MIQQITKFISKQTKAIAAFAIIAALFGIQSNFAQAARDFVLPSQAGHSGECLIANGSWNGGWDACGGGTGGTIGGAVTGGTANRVLFIDASGDLADSGDLTFDSLGSDFTAGTGTTNLRVNPTLDAIELEAPDTFRAMSGDVALEVSGQDTSVAFGDNSLSSGGGRVKLDNSANTFRYENEAGNLIYADLSQNIFRAGTQTGTDDVLLDIDATTQIISARVNDTAGTLVNGLTIDGVDEANIGIFDISTGEGAGYFVANSGGILSADFGWNNGVGEAAQVIASPGGIFMESADAGAQTDSTLQLLSSTGNTMIFDADTSDDFITRIVQSNNLFGAGAIGSAMNYSEETTPNTASVAVGDFTAIGGGNFTAALVTDNGTSSSRVFSDPANGVLNIFDDVDYANTFSSRATATSTNAALAYENVTGTTTSQVFANVTEAAMGFQNASLVSTSLNVQDGSIYANYGGSPYFQINGVAESVEVNKPFILKGYTVATLPTGVVGMTAYVTDALTPVVLSAVVGGGAVTVPVFYNGTTWIVD